MSGRSWRTATNVQRNGVKEKAGEAVQVKREQAAERRKSGEGADGSDEAAEGR